LIQNPLGTGNEIPLGQARDDIRPASAALASVLVQANRPWAVTDNNGCVTAKASDELQTGICTRAVTSVALDIAFAALAWLQRTAGEISGRVPVKRQDSAVGQDLGAESDQVALTVLDRDSLGLMDAQSKDKGNNNFSEKDHGERFLCVYYFL